MHRFLRTFLILGLALVVGTLSARADDLRALARIDPAKSQITDLGGAPGDGVGVGLALSQAVPFRVFAVSDPSRIILEFREVAFEGTLAALEQSRRIDGLGIGLARPGWSRLELNLATPLVVETADMVVDPVSGTARLDVRLKPVSQDEFVSVARSAEPGWPAATSVPVTPPREEARTVIVLDPGHGGVDPGAQVEGQDEADLMLTFARELREVLVRQGGFDVVLTRNDDSFVSLPARVSIARASGASMLLSFHADALAEGRATGTTIYTLSDTASDAASAALAERQDRTDILAGVDLNALDDEIATVLMGMARRETEVRNALLADALVAGLQRADVKLYKRPILGAGFSVLKAPDIPSILIELGFMSSKTDLKRLNDPDWRARVALGLNDAITTWLLEDEIRAARLRK
ncbi:MAG: N-acetylmuramoyl-L-alanine amidase [Litoreibacter sp.]|nr:N-acetylmuramoyl-L-alanine amidase [Litoreibacter sp.]